MFRTAYPLLLLNRLNQRFRQPIGRYFGLGEVLATPRTDLATGRCGDLGLGAHARRGEPLLEAAATADVLALGAGEGLSSQVKAYYAGQVLVKACKGVIGVTAVVATIVDIYLLLHLGMHFLDFLHVSHENISGWDLSSSHIGVSSVK